MNQTAKQERIENLYRLIASIDNMETAARCLTIFVPWRNWRTWQSGAMRPNCWWRAIPTIRSWPSRTFPRQPWAGSPGACSMARDIPACWKRNKKSRHRKVAAFVFYVWELPEGTLFAPVCELVTPFRVLQYSKNEVRTTKSSVVALLDKLELVIFNIHYPFFFVEK